MQVVEGGLVVSPTDMVAFLYCEHLTQMTLQAATGAITAPVEEDPERAVLTRRGLEHEAAYLATLQAVGRQVVMIGGGSLPSGVAETRRALAEGAEVIYQGAFLQPGRPAWRAHADFLTRVETPSRLGPFSYEPEDTKLAHRVRPSAVLQLCHYAEQLEAVQGAAPEWIAQGVRSAGHAHSGRRVGAHARQIRPCRTSRSLPGARSHPPLRKKPQPDRNASTPGWSYVVAGARLSR